MGEPGGYWVEFVGGPLDGMIDVVAELGPLRVERADGREDLYLPRIRGGCYCQSAEGDHLADYHGAR